MNALANEGKYTVSDEIKAKIKEEFYGGCADDEETLATIGETFEKYGYLSDTHTAVALKVYENYKKETGDNTVNIVASTASPYKFAAGVLRAIGGNPEGKDGFEILDELSEKSGTVIPKPLAGLKDKEIRFNTVCEKEEMKNILAL